MGFRRLEVQQDPADLGGESANMSLNMMVRGDGEAPGETPIGASTGTEYRWTR